MKNVPEEIIYSTKNMSTWKSKKMHKESKASRDSGRNKYGKRYPTPLQKWMAKSNRSYKHPQYGLWLKTKNGVKA